MRLTTKVRYGLRALCHVAHRGHASAQAISETQSIPPRYLEEIIADLRKAGLVVGKRGPRGGYRLARPLAEIAVGDVVDALAGTAASPEPSRDDVATLVERAVDEALAASVRNLRLGDLLERARERHRRNAANYVI